MNLRPLVINDALRAEIKRVVDFAEKHRMPIEHIKATMAGKANPIGDNKNYRCVVPLGYSCCYSVEEHPDCWMRHLSVLVLGEGTAPGIPAVQMLMAEFGFKGDFGDTIFHMEHPWPEEPEKCAVNLLQPLDYVPPPKK